MALSKEFKELARHAARRTAPANYDLSNVDAAFRGELAKLCSSVNQFKKNRYDLYDIIIENADDIVPANVQSAIGLFAEVSNIRQGEKKLFKTSRVASKLRARKFLTQVGLSGVYESFRLDSDTFEVKVSAIGGATTVDFERMLDGEESLAEVMEVITEGLTDAVFVEVQKALRSLVSAVKMPQANRVIDNAFDGDKMYKLCSIASAYGGRNGIGSSGAVIFAPPEFIGAMGPDAIVPAINSTAQGIYSPDDIDSIHKTGLVQIFRGYPIVPIPQSFTDANNETTYIDPQLAYILPTGGEKVVKVVFEGDTQIYDWQNKDQSMEVQVYKKMGAAILTYHNICIYQNTGITQTLDPDFGYVI